MAAASLMPIFGQQISSKNDLVPDWTTQEVSTGVSSGATALVLVETTRFGSGVVDISGNRVLQNETAHQQES